MNKNISSSDADLSTKDITLESLARESASKGQNAELLKKYVEAHTTENCESNDIDTDENLINDEGINKNINSYGATHGEGLALAATAPNDEDCIQNADMQGSAIASATDDIEINPVKVSAVEDKELLAIGRAKFAELASIAAVDDIDFDKLMKKKRFSLFCKRALDIVGSFIGLFLISQLLIVVAIIIVCTSKGGVFYRQTRVGKKNKVFKIFKFRTMFKGSDKKGLALTTSCDCRITKIGKILRKLKIDELPQLINVFIGQMSFVGYRPEVPKYVALYSEYQNNIQRLRPGITGLASIEYRNQDAVLAAADNVEEVYIKDVMQKKLVLNMKYMLKCGFWYDIKLIFATILAVFK